MYNEPIKEDTAKLAKERGFDEWCTDFYGTYAGYVGMHHDDNNNKHNKDGNCSAPSQTELQAWLRIKHKMHVGIDYDDGGWAFFFLTDLTNSNEVSWSKNYEKYEEALEAGLQRALNEIKI